MIQNDFEKFIKALGSQNQQLTFEMFGLYATSVLNFYQGSNLISNEEKIEGAKQLCMLFNKGLRNVISASDLKEIADVILQDETLDYQVLSPIFNS